MDFKEFKINHWKYSVRSLKIIATIYYAEKDNKKLTQDEIEKRAELTLRDLEEGIKFCINTKQVLFTETATGRKYSLEEKTKKAFQGLYNQ